MRHSNIVNRAFMLPSYISKDDVAAIHRDCYDIVPLGRVTIEKSGVVDIGQGLAHLNVESSCRS